MKRVTRWFSVVAGGALSCTSLSTDGLANTRTCSNIGGAILTNFGGFGQIDGSATTMGVATGDLKGAIGVRILSSSPDFTSITVQHHWVTEDGETLSIGQADAHGVFVAPGLLAITEYNSHLSGGTGRFANATADVTYIGEVDFNTGHVVLRYSGTLCLVSND